MKPQTYIQLSRRKSQIMDILHRLGEASVADIVAQIPDSPDYHSIRVTLSRMEKEALVRHHEDGPRYIYSPNVAPEKAKRTAIQHLVGTFFAGSPSRAILTILDMASTRLTPEELEEISRRIDDTDDDHLSQK